MACNYMKGTNHQCQTVIDNKSRLCADHVFLSTPVESLSFDDADSEFERKRNVLLQKLGIHMRDLGVDSWKNDGGEIFVSADTAILTSLVGPNSKKANRKIKFSALSHIGNGDVYVFAGKTETEYVISNVPAIWKGVFNLLKMLR